MRIESNQEELIRLLREKPKPHLTIREFAKQSGLSPSTITRRLKEGQIRKERGRIPAKYLAYFAAKP